MTGHTKRLTDLTGYPGNNISTSDGGAAVSCRDNTEYYHQHHMHVYMYVLWTFPGPARSSSEPRPESLRIFSKANESWQKHTQSRRADRPTGELSDRTTSRWEKEQVIWFPLFNYPLQLITKIQLLLMKTNLRHRRRHTRLLFPLNPFASSASTNLVASCFFYAIYVEPCPAFCAQQPLQYNTIYSILVFVVAKSRSEKNQKASGWGARPLFLTHTDDTYCIFYLGKWSIKS